MAVWKFFTGLRSFLCATTVRPPYWGVPGTVTTTTFLLTEDQVMIVILFLEAFWTS